MKSKILVTFIFVIGTLLLATSGCKKNETKSDTGRISSESDYKTIQMIEQFKSDMKSTLKVDREISIDSTIWYMEAAFNETYARANDSIVEMWTDSSFVSIQLTKNGMVSMSSIEQAYENLLDSLSGHYQSVSVATKQLFFVDISLSSNSNNTISVKMTDVIISRPTSNPPATFSWTFGLTDYWIWGYGLGKCDIYAGSGIGKDASTQLSLYATNQLHNGGTYAFINITISPLLSDGNYLFSYGGETPSNPEFNQCLSPQEMNYWLDHLQDYEEFLRPLGKSPVSYHVWWEVGYGSNLWIHSHFANITWGVPLYLKIPPVIVF